MKTLRTLGRGRMKARPEISRGSRGKRVGSESRGSWVDGDEMVPLRG